MEGQKDAAQITPLKERIQHNYPGKKISPAGGIDKGFYSKDNLSALQQDYTTGAVLPKRSRHNKEDKERKAQKHLKSFVKHILL